MKIIKLPSGKLIINTNGDQDSKYVWHGNDGISAVSKDGDSWMLGINAEGTRLNQ